jgi:hypothetical protein
MKRSIESEDQVPNKEIKIEWVTPRYYVLVQSDDDFMEFDITRELTEFEKTILDNADCLINGPENNLAIMCAGGILFKPSTTEFDNVEDLCEEEIEDLDDEDMYQFSRAVPVDKRGSLAKFRLKRRRILLSEQRLKKVKNLPSLDGPFTKIYRFCETD